jgi:hypothetical protein
MQCPSGPSAQAPGAGTVLQADISAGSVKPQTQVTMVTSRPTHLTQGFKPKTQVNMVTSR